MGTTVNCCCDEDKLEDTFSRSNSNNLRRKIKDRYVIKIDDNNDVNTKEDESLCESENTNLSKNSESDDTRIELGITDIESGN